MKRQPMDWEKIPVNHATYKDLNSKINPMKQLKRAVTKQRKTNQTIPKPFLLLML